MKRKGTIVTLDLYIYRLISLLLWFHLFSFLCKAVDSQGCRGFATFWMFLPNWSLFPPRCYPGKALRLACMTAGNSILCGRWFFSRFLSTISTESLLQEMVEIQKAGRKFPLKHASNGFTEKLRNLRQQCKKAITASMKLQPLKILHVELGNPLSLQQCRTSFAVIIWLLFFFFHF